MDGKIGTDPISCFKSASRASPKSTISLHHSKTGQMLDPNLKGDFVSGPPAVHPNTKGEIVLTGTKVELITLTLDHAPSLFKSLCGPQNDSLYTWLPTEPLPDMEAYSKHLNVVVEHPLCHAFTVFPRDETNSALSSKEPIGIISLLNIQPDNRSVEVGYVVFGPKLSRTVAATEVNYLLMKFAFEELHFQRVEWKTNSFNEASKRAALRLGFTYEGLFRKHMVVKGRRRDSWWASCLDDEWLREGKGGVKQALEIWLREENFESEGKQKRKLDDIRENGA